MSARGGTNPRRAGRANPRTIALAAGTTVVLLGAVGVVAWRAKRPAPAAPPPSTLTAPDIRDFSHLPSNSAPGKGEGLGDAAVGKGKGFFAQYVDRNDPTRLAGEITADRSDPLPDRRYELTHPSAWFFQSDGRCVHVQADKGRFTAPAEHAQPTDGVLEGSVRVRMFAATPGGARPNLDTTAPELDVTTSRVSVDWTLGQVDMPEDVVATSARVLFHGRGVSVQFDPASQRLDQLHVASLVKPIVVRPYPSPPGGGPGRVGQSSTPVAPDVTATAHAAPTASPTDAAPPPEERFYALAATEAVEVRQGARVARGEELFAWTRTLGNAFAPASAAPQAESTARAGTNTNRTDRTNATDTSSHSSHAPDPLQEFTLSWKGPLLVRRVEQRPADLARDDAVFELGASTTSAVTLDDPEAGLAARGTRLRYGATREQIVFTGSPASPATVAMRGAGRASGASFEVDAQRGVVRIPGPGHLASDQPPEPATTAPSTIAWTEQGEFQFDSLKGGPASLLRATLVGSVEGTQGALTVHADSATAEFRSPADSNARNLLKGVQLVGRARAADGKGGEFKGDTIHVAFDAPRAASGAPVARRVEASGHALATRGDESLDAGTITATLAAPSPKDIAPPAPAAPTSLAGGSIETVEATGGFTFTGRDALAATGESLILHAHNRSVRLAGSPATIRQHTGTLRSKSIDLSAESNTIHANGPGDFTRTPPADAPDSPSLGASWTRAMTLDDTAGTLLVEGDATFQSGAGPASDREETSVKADTIRVAFEHAATDEQPAPDTKPIAQPPREDSLLSGVAPGSSSRRVLHAEGHSDDATQPVRLEVRRGSLAHDGVIDGRVLYVEGQTITADNAQRTVRVPGAGRLLNSDRRPDLAAAPLPAGGSRSLQEASLPGSGKGDALFSWKQSATLDLGAGSASLEGAVRMVHRRLADSALTELECDHLLATIEEDLRTRRLSSVRAEGSVWARAQGRELTSSFAVYNAPLGVLEAAGGQNADVLVSDPRSGEPLNAKAIRWDLANGRIEVIDPGAITGPR